MTIQHSSLDIRARLEQFKPEDVKKLVQLRGKIREDDLEFILKEPSLKDPHLLAVINEPEFEVRSIGKQIKSGEMYYDLRNNGDQVRIKVICRKFKEEK